MRRHLLLFGTSLFVLHTHAQCDHDPVISPSSLILCPDESAVLTTGVYDAYQWLRDGDPIPGATEQQLVLPAAEAVGYMFTVQATLNGCTETSPGVLVDGWMFLLPFVMHEGDEPYGMVGEGGGLYCEGDTLILTLGMPYTENIQWTNYGAPIPGANEQQLIVTTSGMYHVTAAPSVCPNTIMSLGVTIQAEFTPTAQATIQLEGDELCADIPAIGYTWYLNGAVIPGASTQCIPYTENGVYTVAVSQMHPCVAMSEPFLATAVEDLEGVRARVYPVPAIDQFEVVWGQAVHAWQLRDATGRLVREVRSAPMTRAVIDVRDLSPGRYLLHAEGHVPTAVMVVR